MPSSCFDPNDLLVQSFDCAARTVPVSLDLHPGQVRILDYLLAHDRLPFRQRAEVIRWCVCFGVHTLLGPLPSPFLLIEAKLNVLQDEQFERQKDCLGDSVQKAIAAGDVESARRTVIHAREEYRRIGSRYWRDKWLSTTASAIEMLKAKGVRISETLGGGNA